MTVQLKLPEDIEVRLVAEVNAGRHASLEEAILERLSRGEDPELLAVTGMSADAIRRDLQDAWSNRADAAEGRRLFDRLAAKSAALRAEGR
jgi:hypothetical protein